MKKSFALLAAFFAAMLLRADIVWNADNKFSGWKYFSNAKGEVVDGVIRLSAIRFDCRINNFKVNIDPEKYDTFSYTYRAFDGAGKRGGELFFNHAGEKFADKRSWILPPMVADGQWHTIKVSPKNQTAWRTGGMITALRFDPTNSAGGRIEIKEIKFEPRPQPPAKIIWDKNNNFEGWKYAYHTKKEVVDGILVLSDIKKDCNIEIKGLAINPADYNTFTFTYRAEGTGKGYGQFYFAHAKERYSDARRGRIYPLNADGQWHTVSISPTDMDSWLKGGDLVAFRFDPTDSAGGKIEIKEMYLEKRDIGTDADVKKKLIEPTVSKLDAPEWPKLKSEIWPSGSRNVQLGKYYFQGKMIKSPEDKVRGGTHHEFYLRRKFNLKSKPVYGFLQYTADDCAEAFVNGNAAGFANDWRSCQVYDVSRFLKEGENVLGIHYFNTNTYGGVVAELYVQYADGSCERINSDEQFKSNIKEFANWNKTGFDDSSWAGILHCAPPPGPPWGVYLPYRYFSNMQQIVSVDVSPKVVTAGEKVRFRMVCKGNVPTEAVKGAVLFSKDHLWREDITLNKENFIPGKNGTWTLDFTCRVPLYFNSGKYQLSLEADILSAQSGSVSGLDVEVRRIQCDPKFAQKNSFKVVKNASGQPIFQLNGKPFFAAWFNIPGKYQHIEGFKVNVITLLFESHWWGGGDKINTDLVDMRAQKMADYFPDAYFMFTIKCNFPADWRGANPDEMCIDENGVINGGRHSFASLKARKDFEKQLVAVINYLEKSPYANRIIGYRIVGGYTSEWLGWESASGKALDFSPAAKKAYAAFVREKYPELQNTGIPSGKERHERDGNSLLWNQKKHLNAIAHNDFTSNMVADFMLHLAKKAKEMVGKDKVIGTYYGYSSTLHHTGQSQYRSHYALKKVLDAGIVDYIMSPNSYPLRNMGDTCGEMKPFASLQMNNIIPICEDDTRTHNGYVITTQHQTITEKQTVAQIRRNNAIAICRLASTYNFPLTQGTELSFPSMVTTINTLKTVGQHCFDTNASRKAEIALVVSEETIKSMPKLTGKMAKSGIIDQRYRADGTVKKIERVRPILTYETFVGNQARFNRTGAPVDQLLAEDLADNPGNYKLYVFLNCYKYDEKFLAAVRKLQQRNCVLLWLYAPGYIKGMQSSVDNMKKLTGMDFALIDSGIPAAVTLNNGKILGTPAATAAPMFAVTSPQAEILGKYSTGQTGIAALKTGKALTIFSGVWQLDMEFISDILKRAKVFRYSETLDPFEANDSFVMLHARYPGRKVIRLPRKADVLDVFSGKIIKRNTDVFEYDSELHETRCFYYGGKVEELQEKLVKTTR